jgi:uncharacterized phage infection (PIP) family protein YhgE
MATTPGAGLALEPIGGQNSLDQFIRSIEGLTGTQGQGILQQGQATTNQGVNSLAPSLDLLTKLTKGDQGDVTQAAQPEIDQITQQFDQIRNMISLQPRGGGKTTALAEAPFKKAGDIQRTEGDMRTSAAAKLADVGSNLAGIGLAESGQGIGLEQEAANVALTKQGLDYGQPTSMQQFATFTAGLGNLL